MAHGFLTPQAVSGDNFWKNAKWLAKQLDKIRKAKIWPLSSQKLVNVHVTELQNLLKPGQQKLLSGRKQEALPAAKTPLLGPGAGGLAKRPSGLVEQNATDIDLKTGRRLPPGGPKLPGDANAETETAAKGGSFVDLGRTQAKPLNAENFFAKAVNEGIDANTGQYLSREARIAAFQAGKVERNPAQGPGISADSGVDIVAAVNKNTQMIVSLVEAVKAQTKNDSSIAQKQIETQQRFMLRSAAADEEAAMEKGSDLSGFMTPENLKKKEKQEEQKKDQKKGSKLKEFFKGPNPFQKPEGCGCSPFMPGPGGGGGILGGPPPGGGGGLPIPDYTDQWRDMNRRPGSRLGGGGAVTRRAGGARRATRLATKIGGKGAGKAVAKGLGKFGAKRIPGLGLLAGIAFGAERAMKGDWLGAAGEVASGALGPAGFAIDAGLAARDAGLTPFASGGIVTNPVAGLVGEAGNEGIFPLEGSRGKKTFEMFGQGMIDAQIENRREFAKIQSAGLKQYYENEGGFKKMGEGLKGFFAGLGGALGSLFGGNANAATLDGAADYLDSGIGGSTGERNAAAFLSTLEGGSGQTAADTFQVMLNRTANAKSGGSMKAYGTTLFDQLTAREQFSPFSAAIYGASADSAAAKKYGPITAALGKTPEERKKKLLEIASGPDGLAALQKLFKAGSASAASQVLQDFESGGAMSKSSSQFVGAAMSFRGYHTEGSRRRAQGGNYFFGAAQGTKAASLNAVSAAPDPEDGGGVAGTDGGKVVAASHPDTGSGYTVEGLKDASGRPVIMSRGGAAAFARMMKDSKGQVKGSDVASSQRSAAKNKAVGGVPGSKHLQGNALDIHGTSQTWMRKHGKKYGWMVNDYPGSHGGHFDFKGKSNIESNYVTGAATPPTASPRATSPRASSASSPGSLRASAASPNTGTSMMAASQDVAMGTMALTTGSPTVINNYYTAAGGSGGGVNSNGVGPGIGMNGAAGVAWINQLAAMTRV